MSESKQTMNEQSLPGRRNKRPFYLMWLVALGSLGGAYLVFYLAVSSGLWGTTNHGSFINPPINQAELGLRQGSAIASVPFVTEGTWWLMLVIDEACTGPCDAELAGLKAAHMLLNRDASRVRRALVTLRPDSALRSDDALVRLWGAGTGRLAAGVYIVDPNGNLVLHYPLGDKPGHVLDDMKKLLKVSQIG